MSQTLPQIIKKSKFEKYPELFSSYRYSDELTLELRLPRDCNATDVMLEIWIDDIAERKYFRCKQKKYADSVDVFSLSLDFKSLCQEGLESGLFYYHFSFLNGNTKFYVSRNGHTLQPEIVSDGDPVSSYQLLVYPDSFSTPEKFKGGIMYQIFVDRFNKGDLCPPKREDAVMNDDWYEGIPEFADRPGGFVRNNMFFGGTLYGVCDKLEYLKSLGVDTLYLNPIFEAYSNHKYDTGDYMKVDPMFGGDKALERLIKEAKKRDIKLILDGVFNHTGSDSVYFNKNNRYDSVGAYNSPDSIYRDWYCFNNYPDDYESWWGIEILPKLNGKNIGVAEFICGENGVIQTYLKKGIDGWRLDVADELEPSLLERLAEGAKNADKDALIIGEVWEDASNKIAYSNRRRYFRGKQLDSVMNYPLKNAVIDYLKSGNAENIARVTTELYAHYPKCVSDVLMNFLGTHDTERIITILGDAQLDGRSASELSTLKLTPEQRERAIKRLKLAYAIIATMPGMPCIYYGDEAGLEGARDPFNRRPYPWGREERSLVKWYKHIGKIRKSKKLFADGYYRVISQNDGIFVYERFNKNKSVIIIVNASDNEYTLSFDKSKLGLISRVRSDKFTVSSMSVEIIG